MCPDGVIPRKTARPSQHNKSVVKAQRCNSSLVPIADRRGSPLEGSLESTSRGDFWPTLLRWPGVRPRFTPNAREPPTQVVWTCCK